MFTTDFSGENEQISLIKTDWEESSSYSRSERNVNASGQKNGSLRNYVCILATCTIVNIILFVTVVVLAILSQEETTKSKLKYTGMFSEFHFSSNLKNAELQTENGINETLL